MKLFAKFLTAGTIMAASTFAHATTLSGIIYMSSSTSYTDTITSTGITFNPSGSGAEKVTGGTGNFATLGNDSVNLPNTITFASISTATPYQIFSFADATGTYSFNATSYQANPNGTAYQFAGVLLLGGNVVNTSSIFNFSNSNEFTLQTNDTFSSSNPNPPSATPEPNSLILLGTGLVSAAGMVMRKRRVIA